MSKIENIHIEALSLIASPKEIKAKTPVTEKVSQLIKKSRTEIQAILSGTDKRKLVVVGPCSIHDLAIAHDYAKRLSPLCQQYADKILIVMRVYFEKPRTSIGWKGLINDPHLDGSFDLPLGLHLARTILSDILDKGVPTACELLDPITPQFYADLVSWSSIGARTSESQPHREMASGVSMPVGFKNTTDGDISIALNAIHSAKNPHVFLGINQEGHIACVKTKGNPYGHIILRGGSQGPNYDAESLAGIKSILQKSGYTSKFLIDCSHGNSQKIAANQASVIKDVLHQIQAGNSDIAGLMIESNLYHGNQAMCSHKSNLNYGVSITDECIGWEETSELLAFIHKHL